MSGRMQMVVAGAILSIIWYAVTSYIQYSSLSTVCAAHAGGVSTQACNELVGYKPQTLSHYYGF